MQPSELVAFIFEAFAWRSRPAADRILLPTAPLAESEPLRVLLAAKTREELTLHDLRAIVESNLWMLGPDAFLYFLPAFLKAALESYASISIFVSELIGALTQPSRADVEEALDKLSRPGSELALPADMTDLLRKQQLEWFDSGVPTATFQTRFGRLTQAEGAAILAFFTALEEAHGADFPFGELTGAVDRYWGHYRGS